MKKVILAIGTIFTLFLGLFTIMTIVNRNNNRLTSIMGFTSVVSAGTSMTPEIKENSFLLVHKQKSYEVGDIITFSNNEGIIVTHRIKTIKDGKYITKGDANNFDDGYEVKNEDIYGKVIYKCENKGFINHILVFIIIIAAVAMIGLFFRS